MLSSAAAQKQAVLDYVKPSDLCNKSHTMQFHLTAQHKTTEADFDKCLCLNQNQSP